MATRIQPLEDRISNCSMRLENTLTNLENNARLLNLHRNSQQLRNECVYLLNQVRIIHLEFVILCVRLLIDLQRMNNTNTENLCISFAGQCLAFETRIKVIMPTIRAVLRPSSPKTKLLDRIFRFFSCGSSR